MKGMDQISEYFEGDLYKGDLKYPNILKVIL